MELVGRWAQYFTKIYQKTRKNRQIYIWNPMTTEFWKHWFAPSVWNFPSPAAKSEEKRMFSQTKKLCLNIKNLEKKIIYILIVALKFRKPEQNWAQIPENPKPPARPLSFRTSKSGNPDVNKTSHENTLHGNYKTPRRCIFKDCHPFFGNVFVSLFWPLIWDILSWQHKRLETR